LTVWTEEEWTAARQRAQEMGNDCFTTLQKLTFAEYPMSLPTEKQIKAEIKKLKKMKPSVRMTSMFGDNHHDAIDAQIEVLEDWGFFFDYDAIYNKEEEGEWKENVRSAAIAALDWMNGDEPMAPSEDWESLVIKKA
jgi:hypothetical protein